MRYDPTWVTEGIGRRRRNEMMQTASARRASKEDSLGEVEEVPPRPSRCARIHSLDVRCLSAWVPDLPVAVRISEEGAKDWRHSVETAGGCSAHNAPRQRHQAAADRRLVPRVSVYTYGLGCKSVAANAGRSVRSLCGLQNIAAVRRPRMAGHLPAAPCCRSMQATCAHPRPQQRTTSPNPLPIDALSPSSLPLRHTTSRAAAPATCPSCL